MPAKVTLTVIEGALKGKSFRFEERMSCIVGRAPDRNPSLPNDADHRFISRHHYLLDINPPDVTVRDFGSLNGTYVNGRKIGQRAAGETPEEGAKHSFPEYDLKDGDKIALGGTVFEVGVFVPPICRVCGHELPTGEALPEPGVCRDCFEKARRENRKLPDKPKPKVCAKCGKDVSQEVGDLRQGEILCSSCKSDPYELLKFLLSLASRGNEEVIAIRGYSIIRELGRGGMGATYLAKHDETGRQVALKVMLPAVPADERKKAAFLREVENTKAMHHPNVVELYDCGCSNGTFFFTMEFCEGGSVDMLMMQRGGKLSVDEAIPIVLQALDGLEYAHHVELPAVKLAGGSATTARGLVHRDLKPANIFLSGSGGGRVAKIGDFGLSKAFETAGLSGRTRTGTVAGTPVFMPRQQVVNFKFCKPEVDIWAMAASLYNMLTGQFPRTFPRNVDPWKAVLETWPVPIRDRDSSVPRGLAKVIDLALDDRKGLHFKTAREFKKALEGVL